MVDAMGRLRASWRRIHTRTAKMIVEAPTEARASRRSRRWRAASGELARWVSAHPHAHRHAGALETRVAGVAAAAGRQDVAALADALGEAGAACIDCHREHRWNAPGDRVPGEDEVERREHARPPCRGRGSQCGMRGTRADGRRLLP